LYIGSFDGLLCLDVSAGAIASIMKAQLLRLVLILFGCTVVIVPVAIVLSRSLTKPIERISAVFREISSGELTDLSRSLDARAGDEIGEMSRVVNETFERIRGLVAAIRAQAGAIASAGLELSSNANETAAAITQINANIQNVKKQTVNQSSSVAEVNRAIDRVIQGIERLDINIEAQSRSVERSSSAVEEMLASIASVSGVLATNAQGVMELLEASEAGRDDLASVSTRIKQIAAESAGLLEISALIQQVASKTNLLAMNAAIEAAHAGDAGRGFAVVADEIRNLAESSGKQSKTISASLKKMRESMGGISSAADQVMARFDGIGAKLREVAEREQAMRLSMQEQGAGSKEILEAIGRLGEISGEVRSGSAGMLDGGRGILAESASLGRITEEVAGSMAEMAAGAEQITIAVNRVSDLSRENKDSADTLMLEVGRFKIS